ncbi:MAG: pyridoxamine 5'-phosphate oxidase family protein [Rhizobacter sp.]
MMPLSFLFGRNEPSPMFRRASYCVLTTITAGGQPQARRVRVAACSADHSHLWFVIPKHTGIVADVLCGPNVMLSAINPNTQQLVHVWGQAGVMSDRHSPVYLAPDFRQTEELGVVSDEIDITLMRVDLGDGRTVADGACESEPPHRVFRMFQAGSLGHTGGRHGSQ